MTQYISLIVAVIAIFATSLQLPVLYKANPDFVRSVRALLLFKSSKAEIWSAMRSR